MSAAGSNGEYTPTQKRLMELLRDGQPHDKKEVFKECIDDQLAQPVVLGKHIQFLRAKLRPKGLDIVCRVFGWKHSYQLVRLLASPYKD